MSDTCVTTRERAYILTGMLNSEQVSRVELPECPTIALAVAEQDSKAVAQG